MNIEWKGSAYRIKKCATDLLSVGDLIEDDEEDSWDLMGRDIRLKSTFLYCDFNQVISNAPEELKKPLLELANKLFHYIEELDNAVKIRNISLTQSRYEDAALVLQEVMSVCHEVIQNEKTNKSYISFVANMKALYM